MERSGIGHRVEVKHCVPESLAERALSWARVIAPDPIAESQQLTSIYFDSPDRTFYRWQREKRPVRFKLRLRRYGAGGNPIYAEVKHRIGGVGSKSRVAVPAALVPLLLEPDRAIANIDRGPLGLEEFWGCCRAYAASPSMLVSYHRQALRDRSGISELSITVDRKIVYQVAGRDPLAPEGAAWRLLDLPGEVSSNVRPSARELSAAIVEVKYSGRLPVWTVRLLDALDGYRTSFSKYEAAVRQDLR